MVAVSPYMAIPAMTYGTGGIYSVNASDTTGATLQINNGTLYRVNNWATVTSATNTMPYIGLDTGTGASATVEIDYIQTQTFDNAGLTTPIRMPGYRLTIRQGNGIAQTQYYADDRCVWQTSMPPPIPIKTPAERLKEMLNSRMAPNVLTTCRPLGYTSDVREMRARETLRRVLGEDKFRDFVRRGSVSVRAKSGLVYQIFPGHDFTKVYDRGRMIDRLCVVLQGGFPPTDSLIMRYLMILNNEQQFRSYAVKHGVYEDTLPAQPDQRTLVEIFKEMKKVA